MIQDSNLDKVIAELTDKEENTISELPSPPREENPVYVNTKEELNKTGCGMCLAKWTQVTIHLQNGRTHSCHHPASHKIPLSEIKRNPSALHNTRFKKERRKEMLEGKRPTECDYCWNVEDSSDRFSDRVFKSSEPWSLPYMNEIKNSNWRQDYNPKYVEVAFSNACNFKCSYCGPEFSSTWMEEVEKYGGYPTTGKFNDKVHMQNQDSLPIPHKDYNPYVEAFWKWWPDLYRDLHTFRITGGEPLLSKDTWNLLDYIIDEKNPNRELELAINSNLGIPDKLVNRFIDKIKKVEDQGRVKGLIVYTSVDTWGKQAEYIRNGLEFNRLWDNVNKLLEQCPTIVVSFMSTYNALSVPNYSTLIEEIYKLKEKFTSSDRYWNSTPVLDTSYLRFPTHQTVQVLPSSFSKNILEQIDKIKNLETPDYYTLQIGYSDVEIQKIKRIYDWMIVEKDPTSLRVNRKDFYNFFNEHDKRRNTNFVETFPELEEFYEYCKNLT